MKINTLSLTCLLALSIVSFSAIAASSTSPSNTSSSTATVAATQQQNGQILEIISVIDNNEINAANAVLAKTTNPDVKAFAQTMVADHSENLKAIQTLSQQVSIQPVSCNVSTKLQNAGQAELKKLSSLSNNQLNVDYINAMVKGHTAALALIDDKLLPQASNPAVKAFLTDTRVVVAHHLQLAQAVQKQLAQ